MGKPGGSSLARPCPITLTINEDLQPVIPRMVLGPWPNGRFGPESLLITDEIFPILRPRRSCLLPLVLGTCMSGSTHFNVPGIDLHGISISGAYHA